MSGTIDNVSCAACGLICENITLRIDDQQITSTQGACKLCESQLLDCRLDEQPLALIEGKRATQAEAIARASEILAASRAPLICGLAGSSIETQRAAIALADYLGATIDPTISAFHRATLVAMQSVGVSTCTLGEVKQRADLVLFWGANPTTTHPQLQERFLDPLGAFVPQGRHTINIGAMKNTNCFDEFLQIDTAETLAVLAALRAMVGGIEIFQECIGGVSRQQLQRLVSQLLQASYSVVFFGSEIGGAAEIESLFLLVRQLNTQSRSAAMGLTGTLCENVLTWQTGYPCGVNFSLGYPRYDPHAYSTNTLLERGEVDAVLMVGSENLDELPPLAKARLSKLPLILLENAGSVTSLAPTVQVATARAGVHCGGTFFRMDGVPLKLHAICDSYLPTAPSILLSIQSGVRSSCV